MLESLITKEITVFCVNYIYTGILEEVSLDHIRLAQPAIVYETGPFDKNYFQDAQALPSDLYIARSAIESFGQLKRRAR